MYVYLQIPCNESHERMRFNHIYIYTHTHICTSQETYLDFSMHSFSMVGIQWYMIVVVVVVVVVGVVVVVVYI